MANSYFQFKQFTIWQDRCAMKVGTDGVLLGAWSDVSRAKRILDVGAGTGLVALMLAQRSEALIEAVEIDGDSAVQARENVEASPWGNRIRVTQIDFREFISHEKFDLIVSNPPYFSHSLLSPDKKRSTARHDNSLSANELIRDASRLLADWGELSLVLPADARQSICDIAHSYGLKPHRQLNIVTSPGKPAKRILISFRFHPPVFAVEEMLIEEERHVYSREYTSLTKDFYLKI